MEASARWEIVDLGEDTWEVVVGDAPRDAREALNGPGTVDRGPESERPPEALLGRLTRTDKRLDAVERRLGDLNENEQRLSELERAHVKTERRLDERDDALREQLEEIYKQAERAVAQSQAKPGWRQRRHELKLARQERDRKIRRPSDASRSAPRNPSRRSSASGLPPRRRFERRATRQSADSSPPRRTRR